MSEIFVAGQLGSVELHQAIIIAEHIKNEHESNAITIRIQRMYDMDWVLYKTKKIRELGRHKIVARCVGDAIVIFDDFAGGLIDASRYASDKYNFKDFRPQAVYEALALTEYSDSLASLPGKLVYIDIVTEEWTKPGKLVFQLDSDNCPQSTNVFVNLCEKKDNSGYLSTLIHRIASDGWIQGGEVSGSGSGEAIKPFADECFSIKHDQRGILGYANDGPHSNKSQFYITLNAAPWMDKHFAAFGRLIEGSSVLSALEELKTKNEKPLKDVKIAACGLYKIE